MVKESAMRARFKSRQQFRVPETPASNLVRIHDGNRDTKNKRRRQGDDLGKLYSFSSFTGERRLMTT
jgi:hypothetical protein